MISFILVFLASICSAVIDTCQFHYSTSVFSKLNPKYWCSEISWKEKYVDGIFDNGFRKLFKIYFHFPFSKKQRVFSINYPVAFTDSFHLFKSSMLIMLISAIGLYYTVTHSIVLDILIMGCIWNLVFNVCFNHFFVLKK